MHFIHSATLLKTFFVERIVRARKRRTKGQASVEFALVLFAFLAIVVGLGALASFMQSGALAEHAYESASHHVGGSDSGAWADVLAY